MLSVCRRDLLTPPSPVQAVKLGSIRIALGRSALGRSALRPYACGASSPVVEDCYTLRTPPDEKPSGYRLSAMFT
jgi:hypothetical protein